MHAALRAASTISFHFSFFVLFSFSTRIFPDDGKNERELSRFFYIHYTETRSGNIKTGFRNNTIERVTITRKAFERGRRRRRLFVRNSPRNSPLRPLARRTPGDSRCSQRFGTSRNDSDSPIQDPRRLGVLRRIRIPFRHELFNPSISSRTLNLFLTDFRRRRPESEVKRLSLSREESRRNYPGSSSGGEGRKKKSRRRLLEFEES